jgi:hypothetical protein
MDNNQTDNNAIVTGNDDNVSVISSIVSDNSGGLSSIRILMLAWGLGTFIVWAFVTVMAACHGVYTPTPIPESVITILLGITSGKVCQRPFEK